VSVLTAFNAWARITLQFAAGTTQRKIRRAMVASLVRAGAERAAIERWTKPPVRRMPRYTVVAHPLRGLQVVS
jgi:hypothetical protein